MVPAAELEASCKATIGVGLLGDLHRAHWNQDEVVIKQLYGWVCPRVELGPAVQSLAAMSHAALAPVLCVARQAEDGGLLVVSPHCPGFASPDVDMTMLF